ncbi:prolyl oligopeptidase family serine peptidase [Gemmatimonas sp.]|uniref:prolyl oligopeptidase family serine peptidase n=1 Tax=Gemmatimonas sp. TaxID=1962908 RepID=UPI00391CDBEA
MRHLRALVAGLLTVSLAFAPRPAAAQPRTLTPADLFDLEYVAEPAISPDGEWIVYVRRWSDRATDRRYGNLWIVRSDGTGHRPLTTGRTIESAPVWSPDGSRLAFVSTRGGTPQLWVRWMDRGDELPLTHGAEAPSAPAWSPDGRQLAFLQLVRTPPLVIGTPLTPPPGATWAAPPKYTDRLVFRQDQIGELPTGFVHAFVIPADGGTPRQITRGDYHHGGNVYGGGAVTWSADGAELVLAARRGDNPEWNARETDLFAFNVTNGQMRRLTERFGPDQSPAVSPDGRWIAYTSFDDRRQGYQNTQLHLMARDGSGMRVLSAKLDRSVSTPVWSSDGRAIYVQVDDEGNTKVARFSLEGDFEYVARNLGSGTSAYSGGSFSVARDGRLVVTASTPSMPSELVLVTPRPARGGNTVPPRTLTAINNDVLNGKTLGAVEEIWYTSAKDGRRVQGWIIKPPGFAPDRKYPLILEIHGGPFANYGDRFDEEKQLMAAAGYVVLYTNPRGSTSYGEEFGNLIHHAYPGDDFDDLNSGVDAVIAKGYVDPQHLFVTGGSGGGVLTAWMIGRTNRFRAALAFYPVINWESFVLTADMSSMAVNNWFPGFPWDHPENYAKRSLLSVVEQVRTPTLIMTGEEDFRTPMSESEQYYKALKMRGVETVLVRVPDEPHGIRRYPSHEAAKITTLVGWFAKHRATVP